MPAELRQRAVLSADDDDIAPTWSMARNIAQADLFPKPKQDYQRQQSAAGACLSTAALVVVFSLLVYEIARYAIGWDAYRTEVSVDASITGRVPFHFDITFPSVQCPDLTIDAIDATGAEENDVRHDLFKSPVDANGHMMFLGRYNYVERRLAADGTPVGPMEYDERKDPRSRKFCGNCYIQPTTHHHGFDRPGGVLEKHAATAHGDACCNTCDAVMSFYDMHRIPRPHVYEVEQCIDEMSKAVPGCNIRGSLLLRRVKGNMHIVPGKGSQLGAFGQHIHTFDFAQTLRFNVSHVVNHFAIGDPAVKRFSKRGVEFPLDGEQFMVSEGALAVARYYLKVVPTSYTVGTRTFDERGMAAVPDTSFEYSFQRHAQEFPMGMLGRQPGLFFVFDFHPMQVNNIFERPPVSRFLTRACSIIGGVFVVLGLVDRVVEFAHRRYGMQQG